MATAHRVARCVLFCCGVAAVQLWRICLSCKHLHSRAPGGLWCGAGDLFLDSGTARVIDVAFSPAGIAQASVAYKTFRLKREEGYLLADDRAKQAFATAAEQGFENWHGFNPESERGECFPLPCLLLLLPRACLSRYHGVCW